MAATQSALPDAPDRPVCWRCNGDGKRYVRHAGAWHVVEGSCLECGGSGFGTSLADVRLDPDPREVRQVLGQLRQLGFGLAEWRYAKVPGAVAERAGIREDIRTVVHRGAGERLTRQEMADVLDITRQQLDNIMREDPTGRNRG